MKKLFQKRKIKKYNFEWYIDIRLSHINKMVEAKKGNIDISYFKDVV